MPRFRSKKMPLFKQIKSNKRAISRLKKAPERKVLEGNVAVGNLASGVSTVVLNVMNSGTEWGERIGQNVRLVNLSMNLFFQNNSATPLMFRVMVLFENSPQGTTIDTDELFGDITSNTTKIISVKDPSTQKNFSILYDKVHTISTATLDHRSAIQNIKIRKLLRRQTIFNALDVGTIADIELNALYLVIVVNDTNLNHYVSWTLGYQDS